MHSHSIHHWQHDHAFGQDQVKAGEKRTLLVIIITTCMMVIEIGAGMIYGSMALLADGLHMGSHAAALTITAFAYYYARKHASNKRFSFGTGKVNALAGFSSAVLLAVFALMMVGESIHRFFNPVDIVFNQAILVAIVGLVVNGASVFILGDGHDHHHHHDHDNDHHDHHHDHDNNHHDHHSDHNLRAAYLHVMADALTSLFAIFALLAGKYFGLLWMDPAMGVVGAILVAKWSWGLLKDTSRILLDEQAPQNIETAIREAVEQKDDNVIADLHVWSIGPNIYTAALSIVTDSPQAPNHYKALLPEDMGLVHTTVEIHPCHH